MPTPLDDLIPHLRAAVDDLKQQIAASEARQSAQRADADKRMMQMAERAFERDAANSVPEHIAREETARHAADLARDMASTRWRWSALIVFVICVSSTVAVAVTHEWPAAAGGILAPVAWVLSSRWVR